jgi:hypothetical protein
MLGAGIAFVQSFTHSNFLYSLNCIRFILAAIRLFMKSSSVIAFISVVFCFFWAHAQTINVPANWPNANWSLSGSYNTTHLVANPTIDANLSYDDNSAGAGSNDLIFATSPVIDLSPAQNNGENLIYLEVDYVYNTGAIFEFQYWDAASSSWVSWQTLPENSNSVSNWCGSLSNTPFSSAFIDISSFAFNQLSNFQYRIHYDASSIQGYGFCMSAPRIFSESCAPVSAIALTSNQGSTVDVSWTSSGNPIAFVVEYGFPGFSLGNGTQLQTSNNNLNLVNLTANTPYDLYVRAICAPGDTSNFSPVFSFTTVCAYSAPYLMNFNSGSLPTCWQNLSSSSSTSANAFWEFDSDPDFGARPFINGRTSGTYAWCDASIPNPDSVMLISPFIDLSPVANPYLEFDWFSNNENFPGDNVVLYLDLLDNGNWINLDTLEGDSVNWRTETYDLSSFTGEQIKLRFRTNQTTTVNSAEYNDILLDNVKIDNCTLAAGQDGSINFCRLNGILNLNNNIITPTSSNGIWEFPQNSNALINDSLLDVSGLSAGVHEAYYIVDGICADDTTTAFIHIFPPSSAGIGGEIISCVNFPVTLWDGLSGNIDFGGVWYDPVNSPLPGATISTPHIPGLYTYDYIVSNGVCPSDTAEVEVNVYIDPSCVWSVDSEETNNFSVYPNPTDDYISVLSQNQSKIDKIEVFDLHGRKVATKEKFTHETGQFLSLAHLQKGIYTIHITSESLNYVVKVMKK